MLDAGGGGGGAILGDPDAIREAAGMLETNSSLNESVPEDIRSASSTVLAGWSAPSAQGFATLSYGAYSAATALLDVGAAAAGPLRTYAEALEAAQRDMKAAKADAESAREDAAKAESGSRAEREADADLETAERAMASAREAALAANERAASAISTLTCTLPAIPAGPAPPAPPAPPPEEDKPWWSDAGHLVLDGVGLIPVVGEPADGVNALWYGAEGDELNAGLSAAGMIPFVGWGATGAKLARKLPWSGHRPFTPARELPRFPSGRPKPESPYPHTQLGTRGGNYPQSREFDGNGRPVRDIDWTDHGDPNWHTDPHQHLYGPDGSRGAPASVWP